MARNRHSGTSRPRRVLERHRTGSHDVCGRHALRTINDGTLPYAVLQQTDLKLEITADTMSMTTNGVFRDITHYRRTRVTVIDYPADTLNGSWTMRGQTITFTAQSGAIFAGTVGVSSFSIIGSATTSIYRK